MLIDQLMDRLIDQLPWRLQAQHHLHREVRVHPEGTWIRGTPVGGADVTMSQGWRSEEETSFLLPRPSALFVYMFVCLFTCLFVYMFVCLFVSGTRFLLRCGEKLRGRKATGTSPSLAPPTPLSSISTETQGPGEPPSWHYQRAHTHIFVIDLNV